MVKLGTLASQGRPSFWALRFNFQKILLPGEPLQNQSSYPMNLMVSQLDQSSSRNQEFIRRSKGKKKNLVSMKMDNTEKVGCPRRRWAPMILKHQIRFLVKVTYRTILPDSIKLRDESINLSIRSIWKPEIKFKLRFQSREKVGVLKKWLSLEEIGASSQEGCPSSHALPKFLKISKFQDEEKCPCSMHKLRLGFAWIKAKESRFSQA